MGYRWDETNYLFPVVAFSSVRSLRFVCLFPVDFPATGTEAARATAEYSKYAEADSENAFHSFPRISRISRFNPCDSRGLMFSSLGRGNVKSKQGSFGFGLWTRDLRLPT